MRTNSYSRQRGVGMIEVLVSVLVLSVGLLGIALVQTRALANNNSSMGRSLATVATYSILEAIRADRANLAAYSDISVEGGSCAAGGSTLHEQQINAWCKELADTLGAVDRSEEHTSELQSLMRISY